MPPRVSIVVIGYNDAQHLPAALRSAQLQTMRDIEIIVVDDASTDPSFDLAADLAARDVRLQVHRLDTNSGGCSRPRNSGLDRATGDYVLFLDSDDVLPRRAVERLYAAAVAADADVTCGRMIRRHHHPRRHLPVNDELYRRAEVLDGVLARPAQLRDTPACGKLFRREFLEQLGLRFPEGLLFEDLLFTTTAYAAARRIAIVPALCYVWNVRRQQAEPSITNRRELRNWRDRFEVHRRIDRFLATHADGVALQAAKDAKFLTVDWPIYLRDLRQFPADRRAELLDLAAAYLTERPVVADVDAGLTVASFLAAHGDLEATLLAADYVTTGGIGAQLVVDDGRVYWGAEHLREPGGREALDVTSTGVLEVGFAATPFLAVATDGRLADGALTLTGQVHDVLGRLDGEVDGALQLRGRFGGRVLDCPLALTRDQAGLRFVAAVPIGPLGRRLHPGVAHEVRIDLLLSRAGQRCRVPVTARDARLPHQPFALPSAWSLLLGRVAALVERNGRLVLDLPQLHPAIDVALDLASRGRNVASRRSASRRG